MSRPTAPGRIHITWSWSCTGCNETGTTFAPAERHAETSGHTVWWIGWPS